MKNTTWQGWLFIAGWVLIAAAAVLYGISEYTVDGHKGHVQEIWALIIFIIGLGTMLVGRGAAK